MERKHHHILNIAMALRLRCVAIKFLGECALTVAHLINRTSNCMLHGKSPYEMLYHQQASYTYLIVLMLILWSKSFKDKGQVHIVMQEMPICEVSLREDKM